jgi:hypothetical protein
VVVQKSQSRFGGPDTDIACQRKSRSQPLPRAPDLIIGSQVRALVRPPSSLRKPHISDTTPNRAFLRGFPATHFLDLGLRGRLSVLAAIFGTLSLHPKIPFPAAGIEPEVRPQCHPQRGKLKAVTALNPAAAFSRRCFLAEARSAPHARNHRCRRRYLQRRYARGCSGSCRCTPNGSYRMRSWCSGLDTA